MANKNKAKVYLGADGKKLFGFTHLPPSELKPGAQIKVNTDVDPLTKDIRSEKAINLAIRSLDDLK